MRDVFLTMAIFGTVPLILYRPYVGILVWTWIAFMVPHRLSWGFAYDFRFALLIGGVTILAWLISREQKRLPLTSVTVALIVLTCWISLTTIFAIVPDAAFDKWNVAIRVLAMAFLTIILMNGRVRLHALVWCTVVALGFYGLKGGIFTILGGGVERVWGAGGFIEDNNALAMALIMIIPLMRYLQLQSRVKAVRWGLAVFMIVTSVAIVGTYSRGALVGGFTMLMVLILKSRQRLVLTIAVVAVIGVGSQIVPGKWVARMETIQNYEEDTSATGRIEAWTFAYRLALDNPVLGGGFKAHRDEDLFLSYVPTASTARAIHSIYFEVLGDHGFVGLAIFLWLLVATYRLGSWINRQGKGRPDLVWACDLARMTQVSLVGYAVAGIFLNLAFFDLFYQLVSILVLTSLQVRKALASTPLPAHSPGGEVAPPDQAAEVQSAAPQGGVTDRTQSGKREGTPF